MGPFPLGKEPPSLDASPGSCHHPATLHQAGEGVQSRCQSEPWFEVCPRLISGLSGHTAGPVLEMVGTDDLKSCLIPPPSLPSSEEAARGRTVWSWWRGGEERQGETWGVSDDRGRGTVGDAREANLRHQGKPLSGLLSSSVLVPFSSSCPFCFLTSCFTTLSTFLFPFLLLSNQNRV